MAIRVRADFSPQTRREDCLFMSQTLHEIEQYSVWNLPLLFRWHQLLVALFLGNF